MEKHMMVLEDNNMELDLMANHTELMGMASPLE